MSIFCSYLNAFRKILWISLILYWVFQGYFRPDLVTVHCFGASIDVVWNQRSFKLIHMSADRTFWFSVLIKRVRLPLLSVYQPNFKWLFTVYYYSQHPRYNVILYFHHCSWYLRMQYIRDLGNKMFLENSLQCQSFIMHNPAEVNVKITYYTWRLV